MRKNSKILTLFVAAAVMMAVTACGSKDKTETTASSEAVTEAGAEVQETELSKETSALADEETEDTEAETDTDAEDIDAEDTEEEETEVNLISEAGEISSDGVFQAANGRFEIKVPAGWGIDEGSDDEYVTFLPGSGDDMLEIINVSGSDADFVREVYPDTAEEYMNMVSRGDGMEILKYEVDTKDDGSQTFRYSMKYTDPSDGIHYLAGAGSYDAAKQTYISAVGTVMSESDVLVKQIEESIESFKSN